MSERNLTSLLDHASDELPQLDFAEPAWAGALAARARRRRRALGAVGGVVVAGVVAVTLQVSSAPGPHPVPTQTSTTTAGVRLLPDGTAYAVLPLEGKEAELPTFDAGLPSTIDVKARTERLSTLTSPLGSVVAVFLKEVGKGYQPVLVTGDGRFVLADSVRLVPTTDGANPGVPLGVRAFAGGRYVAFPQPRAVVLLDSLTGRVRTFAVPAATLVDAAWTADQGTIVARSPTGAWAVDPWAPGPGVVGPIDAASYAGLFRLSAFGGTPARVAVTRTGSDGSRTAVSMAAPVTEIWGDTVNTQQWAVAGAFFDQNVVHSVIRRGNGPIYQGLVAAPGDGRGAPQLLLAPESPDGQTGRLKGCCAPLGWADATTVLLRAYGSHGVWVLAWNVSTGTVYEVSRLGPLYDSGLPMPIALNVGWRF